MPTLCGLRRRGYTPKSIRNFTDRIGVSKVPSVVEYGFLEHCLREDLNETAQRVMAVTHPIPLTITNYPEGKTELFEIENNPGHPEDGTRNVAFSGKLYVEADDFLRHRCPSISVCTPTGPECRLEGRLPDSLHRLVRRTKTVISPKILCTYDPDSRGRQTRRWPQGQRRYHPLGGRSHCRGRRGSAL